MRTGKRFRDSALFLGLAAGLLYPGVEPAAPQKWELRLTLQAEGRYQVIERGASYDGDYAFTLLWEGTMEEDGQDFRLIQREARLPDWSAIETSSAAGLRAFKTTGDFPERPAFRYLYVLNEDGHFRINFAVEGFDLPVHPTRDKVTLDLPRSSKSPVQISNVPYDAHIRDGSNDILFPPGTIGRQPVRQTFSWSWKYQQWSLGQEQVVFYSNSHKVTAVVSIRPQSE